MTVEVTSEVLAHLLTQAAAAAPEECCGLLFGGGSGPAGWRIDAAVAAANVADDRLRRFEIDPAALIAAHRSARAGGPQLVGYYHSHPNGRPVPSAIDCAHATGDGRIWAIVAENRVGFWLDVGGRFQPLCHQCAAD